MAYTTKQRYSFKDGYFFSNGELNDIQRGQISWPTTIFPEPGYYKKGEFGIRLENVLEVQDTGNVHPSGNKFLSFQDVTLVPFEPKMIDRSLLSAPEVP